MNHSQLVTMGFPIPHRLVQGRGHWRSPQTPPKTR